MDRKWANLLAGLFKLSIPLPVGSLAHPHQDVRDLFPKEGPCPPNFAQPHVLL